MDEIGALDAVLATNMISVGVDVDRLGTMFVQGQPKTTSEYIQATSRVGRKYPGIVFVLLNSLRSRDLSHFERFRVYHQALYRNVETMSVTPFATGALYKGLTGTLIGFLRQSILEINAEQSPSKIVDVKNQVEELLIQFLQRVQDTDGNSINENVKELMEWWKTMATKYAGQKLAYKESRYVKKSLLKNFNEEVRTDEARPAMMSLRNVESAIEIEVLKS